jgi:hypothetical protein
MLSLARELFGKKKRYNRFDRISHNDLMKLRVARVAWQFYNGSWDEGDRDLCYDGYPGNLKKMRFLEEHKDRVIEVLKDEDFLLGATNGR